MKFGVAHEILIPPERNGGSVASKYLHKPSQLLLDMKKILEKLGFNSIVIKPFSIYQTKEKEHRAWLLNLAKKEEKYALLGIIEEYASLAGYPE